MKTLLCTAAVLGLAALPATATTMGAPTGSSSSSSAGGGSSSSSTMSGSSGTMGGSMGAGFSQEQLRQALTQSGLRNITILSGGSASSATGPGGSSSSSSSSSSSAGAASMSGGDVYVVRAEVPNGGAVLITIVPQSAMMGGTSTAR